jgi:hypothetical protein
MRSHGSDTSLFACCTQRRVQVYYRQQGVKLEVGSSAETAACRGQPCARHGSGETMRGALLLSAEIGKT